jgi:hypothetical protein
VRGSWFADTSAWDNQLNYAEVDWSRQHYGEDSSRKETVSLRVFDPVSTEEKPIIDPVNVSAEWLRGAWAWQLGFMRHRFSETFGFQILDVANPRDYGDYLLNDLAWAKRSVFSGVLQWARDGWQLQGIVTPWANGDRLPWRGSPFDVVSSTVAYQGGVVERPWFASPEYGARVKRLFENGLDVGLLYYRHHARPTLLELVQTGVTQYAARPTDQLVQSTGASFSQVWGDWVVRGDALLTFQDVVQGDTPLSIARADHFQTLLGVDRTWGDWLFGGQWQEDPEYERRTWGARTEWQRWEAWRPSLMMFRGEEGDSWLQLRQRLNWEGWRADIAWDMLDGPRERAALFGYIRRADRVLVDVGREF